MFVSCSDHFEGERAELGKGELTQSLSGCVEVNSVRSQVGHSLSRTPQSLVSWGWRKGRRVSLGDWGGSENKPAPERESVHVKWQMLTSQKQKHSDGSLGACRLTSTSEL